ncbi:MAG: hypothetical protein NUV60_01175 [Patescibacteria group bacterium]|nr:hypothetical protein [Patescibacteria group bacterium]
MPKPVSQKQRSTASHLIPPWELVDVPAEDHKVKVYYFSRPSWKGELVFFAEEEDRPFWITKTKRGKGRIVFATHPRTFEKLKKELGRAGSRLTLEETLLYGREFFRHYEEAWKNRRVRP